MALVAQRRTDIRKRPDHRNVQTTNDITTAIAAERPADSIQAMCEDETLPRPSRRTHWPCIAPSSLSTRRDESAPLGRRKHEPAAEPRYAPHRAGCSRGMSKSEPRTCRHTYPLETPARMLACSRPRVLASSRPAGYAGPNADHLFFELGAKLPCATGHRQASPRDAA